MRSKPPMRSMPLEVIDVPIPIDEPMAPAPVGLPSRTIASGATASPIEPFEPPPVDLGPDGPAVRELLSRAANLSRAERHRLGEVAAWRWWPLTLPVGGTSAGTRATAILRARGAGRGEAVRWIEAQAGAVIGGSADAGRSVAGRAIANAALALLARDLVDEDVFDALYGPWREVTHR